MSTHGGSVSGGASSYYSSSAHLQQQDTVEARRLELSLNEADGSLQSAPLLTILLATTDAGVSAAAALWVGLRHQLSTMTDHWMLAMGVIFVVLVLVAGDGIDGALRGLWRRLTAGRSRA